MEGGVRATLNLGHTFGHAMETGQGYGVWLHGEAVASGMVMAAHMSETLVSCLPTPSQMCAFQMHYSCRCRHLLILHTLFIIVVLRRPEMLVAHRTG